MHTKKFADKIQISSIDNETFSERDRYRCINNSHMYVSPECVVCFQWETDPKQLTSP